MKQMFKLIRYGLTMLVGLFWGVFGAVIFLTHILPTMEVRTLALSILSIVTAAVLFSWIISREEE